MAWSLAVSFLLSGFVTVVGGGAGNCVITAKECFNFPQFRRTQFRDKTRFEDHPEPCLRRSEEFHKWCGNEKKTSVAATYTPSLTTQVYRPKLCDPGWSLYAGNCYLHDWRRATWWESDAVCKSLGGNLASIHSEEENRFVFGMTRGLTAWIGFVDIRKKEEPKNWQWTDTTEHDFSNWSRNCTGREHEPDCAPEQKAQQWYEWDGGDKGTFVCKKEAKKTVDLIVGWTLDEIAESSWKLIRATPSETPIVPLNNTLIVVVHSPRNVTESFKAKNATKGIAADDGFDLKKPDFHTPISPKGLFSTIWKSLF